MKLVLASTNRGKLKEIAQLLAGLPIDLVPVSDFVPDFAPAETGRTFEENARIKASAAFVATGLPCVADDSGLCVAGLGLEPGVRSSRYAGDNASDAQRVAFLLARMVQLEGADRRAYFSCTVCAILPEALAPQGRPAGRGMIELTAEGRVPGTIGFTARGSNGFGYDPVFHPDADPSLTLAELGSEEKNAISHRGKAFAQLAEVLRKGFSR